MIIFLYGEDTFRSRSKLKEFKDKFLREVDPQGTSLTFLDGEKTTLQKINEAIGSASLLSRKRMVVIENLFNQKEGLVFEQLLDFFKKQTGKAEDNIIIILDSVASGGKALTKHKGELLKFLCSQKYAYEFKSLSNFETATWAKNEIELIQKHNPVTDRFCLIGPNPRLWDMFPEKVHRKRKFSKYIDAVSV